MVFIRSKYFHPSSGSSTTAVPPTVARVSRAACRIAPEEVPGKETLAPHGVHGGRFGNPAVYLVAIRDQAQVGDRRSERVILGSAFPRWGRQQKARPNGSVDPAISS